MTLCLKFLLFYLDPKGDKMNFKLVSVKKWLTLYFVLFSICVCVWMVKYSFNCKSIDGGFAAKIDYEFSEIDLDIILNCGSKNIGYKSKRT